MGNSRRAPKNRSRKYLYQQPERKEPVSSRMKSIRSHAKAEQPQHFNFGFWKADQERAHQSGDGTGSAERGGEAAGIRPRIELQRHRAGKKIENRVDDAPPGILQNGPGKPQKPHVADNVQPAAVQKIRGDVRNWLRMRRNERVMRQNRVVLKFRVLLRQRIHLSL